MNLERTKTFLIFLREAPKTAAWYGLGLICVSLAIFVLVLTGLAVWYLPSVANSYAHAMEAQAKQIEQNTITTDVGEGVKTLMTKLNTGADEFVEGSRAFKDASVALGPQLQSITDNANEGFDEVTGLVADARRETLPILNGAADGAKRMIDNSEPNVTKATASIQTAAASFAHSMEQIDARISDPKTAQWIDEQMDLGHKVLLKVDEIAGKTVAMSSNGEQMTAKGVEIMGDLRLITKDSSEFVHGYLTTKPRWWQRFILTPLKAALGYGLSVYQITR